MDAPMIKIGGTTTENLVDMADAIVKVATCSPHPKVSIMALEVLMHMAETKNVTISNCTFTNETGPEETGPEDTGPMQPLMFPRYNN